MLFAISGSAPAGPSRQRCLRSGCVSFQFRPSTRSKMSAETVATEAPSARVTRKVVPRLSRDDVVLRVTLGAVALYLVVFVVLPLISLLGKSLFDRGGAFVGLANFTAYFGDPALARNLGNSLFISVVSTLICIVLAFAYAYGLTRTCMPARGVFKTISQIPILAPSLMPAISLVYLFGNQGLIKGALMGASVYGPIGIVMGEVFWTFPHALIILTTALAVSDDRIYGPPHALKAAHRRTLRT